MFSFKFLLLDHLVKKQKIRMHCLISKSTWKQAWQSLSWGWGAGEEAQRPGYSVPNSASPLSCPVAEATLLETSMLSTHLIRDRIRKTTGIKDVRGQEERARTLTGLWQGSFWKQSKALSRMGQWAPHVRPTLWGLSHPRSSTAASLDPPGLLWDPEMSLFPSPSPPGDAVLSWLHRNLPGPGTALRSARK